jgi:hypothetical protein
LKPPTSSWFATIFNIKLAIPWRESLTLSHLDDWMPRQRFLQTTSELCGNCRRPGCCNLVVDEQMNIANMFFCMCADWFDCAVSCVWAGGVRYWTGAWARSMSWNQQAMIAESFSKLLSCKIFVVNPIIEHLQWLPRNQWNWTPPTWIKMVGLGLPYDTHAISAGSHGVWGLDVWDPEWFPASWGHVIPTGWQPRTITCFPSSLGLRNWLERRRRWDIYGYLGFSKLLTKPI